MMNLHEAEFKACARRGGERIALMARPDKRLWAVAQAIGQHGEADWAAATVVRQIEIAMEGQAATSRVNFCDGISRANSLLLNAGEVANQPVQSAVAALGFNGATAFGYWIGNCRIYRLRHGHLTLLSEDHDLATELQSRGSSDVDQKATQGLARVLTRAIGCAEVPEPARFVEQVMAEDRYLICGAGLARVLNSDEIARQLGRGIPREAIDRLHGLYLSRGGIPNFGAVVIDAPTEFAH
jgi:serine/threonine protein phosphatase PrpC